MMPTISTTISNSSKVNPFRKRDIGIGLSRVDPKPRGPGNWHRGADVISPSGSFLCNPDADVWKKT
jgi:hypothetical protein